MKYAQVVNGVVRWIFENSEVGFMGEFDDLPDTPDEDEILYIPIGELQVSEGMCYDPNDGGFSGEYNEFIPAMDDIKNSPSILDKINASLDYLVMINS